MEFLKFWVFKMEKFTPLNALVDGYIDLRSPQSEP